MRVALDKLLATGAGALLLISCSGEPEWVLPQEKMATVMADLELADAVAESGGDQWARADRRQALRLGVMTANGVTAEQYDTSLVWYGQNIDKYNDVCRRAIEITEERIADSRRSGLENAVERLNTVSADGDSVDLWTWSRMRRLDDVTGASIIEFSLPQDHNAEPGDIFCLRLRAQGVTRPLLISIAADYTGADAGTETVYTTVTRDGTTEVRLPLDPSKSYRGVYGAILAEPAPSTTLWVDSLAIIRLRDKPGRR